MRELTDEVIKTVCAGYGIQLGHNGGSPSIDQVRAVMDWARMDGRAETIREKLIEEQKRAYDQALGD